MKGLRKMNKRTEAKVTKTSKKSGIAKAVLVAVVLVLVTMLFGCSNQAKVSQNTPTENATVAKKNITIEVVDSSEKSTVYDVSTEAEFLRGAMDDAEGLEYSGEEGAYGMMVKTVNGELADYNTNGAYWAFNVNGAYCNHGIDTQPVNNGDEFVIAYTKE